MGLFAHSFMENAAFWSAPCWAFAASPLPKTMKVTRTRYYLGSLIRETCPVPLFWGPVEREDLGVLRNHLGSHQLLLQTAVL